MFKLRLCGGSDPSWIGKGGQNLKLHNTEVHIKIDSVNLTYKSTKLVDDINDKK